jgi:hypothetical protein
MNASHPDDLLAAYALDALAEAERAEVRAHVAGCARCRLLLREFQQVTEVLPLAHSEHGAPPPELRQRIMAAARSTPQLAARQPARRHWRVLVGSLNGWIAAALFLVALALGGWDVSQHRMLAAIQRPVGLQATLAATADAPGAAGNVTVVLGRAAVISVDHLAPRSGLVYEAWVVAGGVPKPAGTFATTPDGHGDVTLTQPLQPGDTIAITAEPPPGTPAPTGKVLLAGKAPPTPAG